MRSVVPRGLLAAACLVAAAPAHGAPTKLTFEEVLAKTFAGPRARMAESETAAARARSDEADAARMPRGRGVAFGTISPEINCLDPQCNATSPQNFAWRFSGLFGSAQLDVTQPLYTFGKIASARAAAQAGVKAQRALADEAAGDLAVEAARAYWGLKLARELGIMLDDGIDEIDQALEKYKDRPDLTITDRQRVAVLVAEARIQRADARMAEEQALAGLRALTGIQDVDVDDAPFDAVARDPNGDPQGLGRPQAIAARFGAQAADHLAELAARQYWPDLALVGTAVFARAQGADDPPSVFANDPFNRNGVGAVLALQWTIEPWTTAARTERARAEATRAHAQAELAEIGAAFDAQSALAEVTSARARVAAAEEGVKSARTWLAAVLQQDAVGGAEPRDFADAYIGWFQMRARWALAVMQLNVALTRYDRARGAFQLPR